MQLLWEPQSVQWKIAILIIALVVDVSGIRNGNGEEKPISAKLKNFFPSEEVREDAGSQNPTETSARVISGAGGSSGFRPSQMLDFTPSDVMPSAGFNRYPPSYLEPNYKHEVPSSLGQQVALDKQFSFPEENSGQVFHSTPLPTTPVVSYLDPYTQQNYRYTPTPPSIIQYQREQPQGDQAYTVQSSLLVGSHQNQQQRPGHVDEVYLKRPGYVFDESPSPSYRRPTRPPPSLPPPPTTSSQKISYDSHDYPPPSYAAQQTSNFVPQQPKQRPLYQRQDIRGGAPASAPAPVPAAAASSNYANSFDNYLQRPSPQQIQIQSPNQIQSQFGHYQYNPQNGFGGGLGPAAGAGAGAGQPQRPRPGHNYYEYQIGEIPPPQSQHFQHPQQQQQFNYRPATQSPAGGGGGGGVGGGLATLASLLSSTQQYAPQFTNLLLGGGGSPAASSTASQSSSSPLGSLLGAFAGTQGTQGYQSGGGRPPNTQLIRALENIARNDDLQCVPKVLCQMIAGQTLRGQLPGFVTSPAITNFLAGFPVASPALIYGRAALLGLSGGDRSCIQTYEKCPKNEMEIIHYLNNHRGGFFKFFSEPEEQPTASHPSDGGTGTLFSILSALTGGGGGGGQSYTTPRPVPRPTQRPSTDIASGIGSFFTQVLSEYLNGVEYQRRRRRSLQLDDDFHDEEDNLDTQTRQLVKFQDDEEEEDAKAHTELIGVLHFPAEDEGQGRVVNFKDIQSEEQFEEGAVRFPDATPADVIREFNRDAAQRKLKFPQDQEESSKPARQSKALSFMEGWKAVLPNGLAESDFGEDKRRGKRIVFRDTNEQVLDEERLQEERLRAEEEEQFREAELIREEQLREAELIREEQLREQQIRDVQLREEQFRDERFREEQLQIHREIDSSPPNAVYEEAAPPQRGARVIFPDHYEQHIRKGKILNRPTYAPTYEYNHLSEESKEDRLVVSDEQRPPTRYRLEGGFDSLNYGEYMPGNTVRFAEPANERPHYNYPSTNYISDNRYGSSQHQKPHYEDDKNIYVTNSQGINEYYIRPDGSKVYLNKG
ncbi:hypothetical protein KR018_011055 [Drosophila ironensis]|nr:hypothetical protein KR018_011055 [Drosophila ironensis]